jgi:hypothetical protein
MSPARLIVLALVVVARPGAIHAAVQDLGKREQLILNALDTNSDGTISCQELATFLNPVVIKMLRDQGVEPNRTSHVPACGPRNGPAPAPADEARRSPEKNYEEFFRGLIQGALNAATSLGPSYDAIAPAEILELERAHLPEPLVGRFSDLLPALNEASAGGESWTDTLAKWIQIRQSFLDDASIGKPAKLSWTNHGAGDETIAPGDVTRVFTINAAVILNPPVEWTLSTNVHVRPVAAYEVDLESNASATDQIVTRIGLSSVIVRDDSTAAFSSHVIDWTFDYYTNRDYSARVFGTTFQYTPNYRQIGIGQYLGHGAVVDFRWRPYVGVVWNHVTSADDVAAYKKETSFTHGFARFTGEIRLTGRGKITPEFRLWHGDRVAADGTLTHWQTQQSIEGRLALVQSAGVDRASLTLTWTHGRDSPDFLLEKSTVLALGIKF